MRRAPRKGKSRTRPLEPSVLNGPKIPNSWNAHVRVLKATAWLRIPKPPNQPAPRGLFLFGATADESYSSVMFSSFLRRRPGFAMTVGYSNMETCVAIFCQSEIWDATKPLLWRKFFSNSFSSFRCNSVF